MTERIQKQIARILEVLKLGTLSTSEIAFRTNLNFYLVEARLEHLHELKQVEKDIIPKGTYWKLKESKQ